jgi:3-oxoacyl-[acyl-carrier protein] reductase
LEHFAMNSANSKELAGRVAIVTGAGRNIGRAIALDLAAGGADVVVNARTNRQEAEAVVRDIAAAGGRAIAALADVADQLAVERMAKAAVERFGRIDMLINNAAVRRERALDEMTLSDWHEILGIVLDGAFNCLKATLPQLRASGGATIVNIGGLSASTGARHRAHVVTAKAGLEGFTRALAHELAVDNVTVNCVSPGFINTTRPQGALTSPRSTHQSLSGRQGEAREIAATVRFLCGPGARYITGQTIHVNGGAFLA